MVNIFNSFINSISDTVFSKINIAVGFSADFVKNLAEGNGAVDTALSSKLNPVYGGLADTAKGIVIDGKDLNNSVAGSAQSSIVANFIEKGSEKLKLPTNTGRFISSYSNKYIESKTETQTEKNK